MPVTEGNRSPFSAQPSAGFPKLSIYESLFLLNQGIDHVVAILRGMERFLIADKESIQSALAEIEEIRSGVNADFVEQLGDRERFDECRFWKQRRAFEKKWRDPDDVYIDVVRREEERKKQGLPSRIVGSILPHSAVAQAEERWEAARKTKKKRVDKHQKLTSQDKSAGREKDHD